MFVGNHLLPWIPVDTETSNLLGVPCYYKGMNSVRVGLDFVIPFGAVVGGVVLIVCAPFQQLIEGLGFAISVAGLIYAARRA